GLQIVRRGGGVAFRGTIGGPGLHEDVQEKDFAVEMAGQRGSVTSGGLPGLRKNDGDENFPDQKPRKLPHQHHRAGKKWPRTPTTIARIRISMLMGTKVPGRLE